VGVREGTSILLDRDMANVSVARHFVRAQLTAVVAAPALDDLVLATSELVTNAFEHGADAATTVAVRVGADDASITVTSRTDSTLSDTSGVAPTEQWASVQPEQLNGRGLGIVRKLADRVDVRHDGDSLQITIVRKLDASV